MRLFRLAICSLVVIFASAAQAQTAPCKIAQLAAVDDSEIMTATVSHEALTIAVRNRSSSVCSLNGVPVVGFADKINQPLPVHVCSNCSSSFFPEQPAEAVVLQPDHSAYLVIGYADTEGSEGCKPASHLNLRLTGRGGSLKIPLPELRTCGLVDISPFLAKPPSGLFPASDAVAGQAK